MTANFDYRVHEKLLLLDKSFWWVKTCIKRFPLKIASASNEANLILDEPLLMVNIFLFLAA